MPHLVQHTDLQIGLGPVDRGAADAAGEDIGEQRAGVLRRGVRRNQRDGATGGVLARGFAGGNAGGGGAYHHHVSLEFTGRGAGRRRLGCQRAGGTGRHAGGDFAIEADVAANHAVRRRIGTNAVRTDHHAHETSHAAAFFERDPAADGVAMERAALATEGAQRLGALLASQRVDAILPGGQGHAPLRRKLLGDGGLQLPAAGMGHRAGQLAGPARQAAFAIENQDGAHVRPPEPSPGCVSGPARIPETSALSREHRWSMGAAPA